MNRNKPEAKRKKFEASKDSEKTKAPDKLPKDEGDQNTKRKDQHQQDLLDEAIEESFPASDPPTACHVD